MIEKYKVLLPSIRVDYNDLSISTQALVGDEGFATVGNSFKNMFKVMTNQTISSFPYQYCGSPSQYWPLFLIASYSPLCFPSGRCREL